MSAPIPMAACLALLRVFDAQNESPQQTITAGAATVEATLGEEATASLSAGQFAALIDFWLAQGADAMATLEVQTFAGWIQGGNFVKPPKALATYGVRGRAERDVWNVGAFA